MNNLGLKPRHMKHGRLYHFFGDLLGFDCTRPRTECNLVNPRLTELPSDEEMEAIVGKYIDDPGDVLPLVD